ncbi:hypothetical protein TBR22_A30460 [Luteitalea sp. TBR-22]|nr:hypothetical protein TBR22_A30460 [Luteitalea sp. TBR-22]
MLTDPHLQRALDLIDSATRDFTSSDWETGAPGRWSRAAILEHLGKAYAATAYILDKCVHDGAPKGTAPAWRQRLFTWLIVDVGWFPTGARAPAMTLPEGMAGAEALAYARRSLQALDEAAVRCAAAFAPAARVATHPILGGFTVDQWRRFHWSHTRHHVRQIARRR